MAEISKATLFTNEYPPNVYGAAPASTSST